MFLTLLAFAFAIGLLVVIHELGHYSVARYCGVHVERFSFGFGKVLAKYTDRRGCEWAFSAIPLGGYVMMRNHAPETASTEYKNSTVQSKTVWQRIDRKSTRLNSSHVAISYAVFCLKKKKKTEK